MSGRFLSEPFGAYHQAVMPPVDDTLVRVGPGTPGGEYLRRFWHPFLHVEELGDLPLAMRLLGEDLVAFPDGSGHNGRKHNQPARIASELPDDQHEKQR